MFFTYLRRELRRRRPRVRRWRLRRRWRVRRVPPAGRGRGQAVTVQINAQVTLAAVALAGVLALAGGLIVGGFGGWRAARVRPADALARVE
jgi:ABC-type lipoprotein release transport system permease subunit